MELLKRSAGSNAPIGKLSVAMKRSPLVALRQVPRGLSTPNQASRCRSLRVHARQPVAEQILRAELRHLATHIGALDRELRGSKAQPRKLVGQVMPACSSTRRRADERRHQRYLARRRSEQKTDPEIRRCLKRDAARQLSRLMESAATT